MMKNMLHSKRFLAMKDFRKEPRLKVSLPVECKLVPRDNFFYTTTKDLSSHGLQIGSDDFIPQGNILNIFINYRDKLLQFQAKVVWCKEDKNSQYGLGLEIIKMNQENKFNFLTLLDYVHT